MNDHFQIPFPEISHTFLKTGEGISTADIPGGFLMDSLKTKLHPYRFLAVQSFQKIQHIRSQTIRPGADGYCRHQRMFQSFRKDFFQIFHRGVSIGICLKISDKSRCVSFLGQFCRLLIDLLSDRIPFVSGKISRTSLTAENTAPASQSPVPVWTGHAAV